MKTKIEALANFYGNLNVKEKKGKYYAKVSCAEGLEFSWKKISKKLYKQLIKFNSKN